jgi:hypothetical protein
VPFKSEKQRRYMHARHPSIAERWEAESKGRRKARSKKKINEAVKKANQALDKAAPTKRRRK